MADHQQPALDVDAARADLLRRQIRIAIETVFRLQREQGDPISWEVYNLQPRETPGEIILTEEEVDILMTDEVLVRELGRFIAQEIDGVNVRDDDDEADDQESEPDEDTYNVLVARHGVPIAPVELLLSPSKTGANGRFVVNAAQ
ncbi:hypothetical protein PMZ80_007493 [Knufia obscura]|uniref:Uncharacterized protein n=2 Tax=Knufia TaxID=430999 RepID=A0AAN8I835_9EURO|nr:hypothetical protein PMZ80_007493 [Knufia obscura]KAK5954036.1 hypothetical protein OHC33_004607 [Knufia fluminis]